MTFGILEDKYLQDVPGTALLSDLGIVHGHQVVIGAASKLKRGTGRDAHVVLIPQPSDDPNDPLNWPRWKKEACFWTLTFGASLDGALAPLVSPGYVLLSTQFGVSIDEVASSFGALVLGLGCFMLFQNALATKFGHRIVYLGSVSLMFIACIWCALSPSISSIRVSRVFQGFGLSALQSLFASTIEQLFFVHERGNRSAIWSFSIMSGITLGPLIYSYVIQDLTWRMGFWFVVIPLGICLVLVFFFVPETTYTRVNREESTSTTNDLEEGSLEDKSLPSVGKPIPSSKAYTSQLRIWGGIYSQANILKIFLRPFPFLLSPVTWFFFCVFGMQTVLLSALSICTSTIFTIEYNFTATQITGEQYGWPDAIKVFMNPSFVFSLSGQCFLVFSAMQDGLSVLHTTCLGSEQWPASL